ncbi:hypothetical protein FLONG3_2860 [Fusarium longipes]|uniref:Uncharacterized protein n=1 Tax=Fusarium longipes TaxID=694270 RepID=A0A395T3Z9_9HYPO|nr:hypothetical protein FLONG3_2860 [Fusarium longipes]
MGYDWPETSLIGGVGAESELGQSQGGRFLLSTFIHDGSSVKPEPQLYSNERATVSFLVIVRAHGGAIAGIYHLTAIPAVASLDRRISEKLSRKQHLRHDYDRYETTTENYPHSSTLFQTK